MNEWFTKKEKERNIIVLNLENVERDNKYSSSMISNRGYLEKKK